MLIPNHPDDEWLSAFAADDPEAVDPAQASHVASCERCTAVVTELASLRMALAELPDLAPSRPLQLVPPVPSGSQPADRVGGWVRRFFTPALAAGAAIALVGAVGTTTTNLASSQSDSAATDQAARENFGQPAASAGGAAGLGASSDGGASPATESLRSQALAPDEAGTDGNEIRTFDAENDGSPLNLAADRSLWPMVLFSGVALMIAALLLRWILVPRAG